MKPFLRYHYISSTVPRTLRYLSTCPRNLSDANSLGTLQHQTSTTSFGVHPTYDSNKDLTTRQPTTPGIAGIEQQEHSSTTEAESHVEPLIPNDNAFNGDNAAADIEKYPACGVDVDNDVEDCPSPHTEAWRRMKAAYNVKLAEAETLTHALAKVQQKKDREIHLLRQHLQRANRLVATLPTVAADPIAAIRHATNNDSGDAGARSPTATDSDANAYSASAFRVVRSTRRSNARCASRFAYAASTGSRSVRRKTLPTKLFPRSAHGADHKKSLSTYLLSLRENENSNPGQLPSKESGQRRREKYTQILEIRELQQRLARLEQTLVQDPALAGDRQTVQRLLVPRTQAPEISWQSVEKDVTLRFYSLWESFAKRPYPFIARKNALTIHYLSSNDPDTLCIYTDGGVRDDTIVAAAVTVTKCNIRAKVCSEMPSHQQKLNGRKTYGGKNYGDCAYLAEVEAILLALQSAQVLAEPGQTVLIWTDSIAHLQADSYDQELLNKFDGRVSPRSGRMAELLKSLEQRNIKVEISWIPRDAGVTGNYFADATCKYAATGLERGQEKVWALDQFETTAEPNLPRDLQSNNANA